MSSDPSDEITNSCILSQIFFGKSFSFLSCLELDIPRDVMIYSNLLTSQKNTLVAWSALIVWQTVWLLVRIILYKYRTYYAPTSPKKLKALFLLSGLQILHQLRDPVNNVINNHHFRSGIPGINFNFIPNQELA